MIIRHPLAPLVLAGTILVLLVGAGLWAEQARRIDWFVGLALLQGGVYAGAVTLAKRPLGKHAFTLILAVAVLLRVIASASPQFLSTDINRYVWDGRVEAAGINPYRYVPNDPALAGLRDTAIWPAINRAAKAHTIYPPVAQMIFLAAQAGGSSRAAMKSVMILLEAVGIFALFKILVHLGQKRERLIVYLWHPLAIWEIAGSGHIDAALVAFVPLAIWAWLSGKQGWAGTALAAATLVKFFPLILAPGLWGKSAWQRRDFRLPLVMAVLIVVAYIPYLRVGFGVFGYLSGYSHEEHLGSGSGFWLVEAAHLPPLLYVVPGAVLLVWLAYRSFISKGSTGLKSFRNLAVAFVLLASPHYAWYFVWLIPLLTVTSCDYLLWPTMTSFILYLAPTPSIAPLWIGAVIYGGTALLYAGVMVGRGSARGNLSSIHD